MATLYLDQLLRGRGDVGLLAHDAEAALEAGVGHLLLEQRHQVAQGEQHAQDQVIGPLLIHGHHQA